MNLIESWIDSANDSETDFPLNNLPCGVFSPQGETARCGVAIGDLVLDLAALESEGLAGSGGVFSAPSWNLHMAQGPKAWALLRTQLVELLRVGGNKALQSNATLRDAVLYRLDDVRLHMPFTVTEFTDFYAGRHHATNVGTMFRGAENALPPNWLHMPIGYNGRASTVVVSGTDIRRPCGQLMGEGHDAPIFAPSRRLDFELEMGAVIGTPSVMGERLTPDEADGMIFGYVMLNDWSARDIQKWEYQPLGPFQAKAFATTISPWIVTKAALEPFRAPMPEPEKALLAYLQQSEPGLFDIDLEVALNFGGKETIVSSTNYREMYYSAAQQIAHHASSGCAMRTGDLIGSGTISGPGRAQRGSMLEISWGGREPITLDGGQSRTFLEDGDSVVFRGAAKGQGFRVGFGECAGKVHQPLTEGLPAGQSG